MAISAGPFFKLNPSVSLLVACKTKEEVDVLWNKLIDGGKALMELGEYPFSPRYGWLQDKYGLSWQIMFYGDRSITQSITPVMMFVGANAGKAEEAIKFYTSIFHDAKIGEPMRRKEDQGVEKAGTMAFAPFTLEGQEFAAMDSALDHKFNFNEAISLLVNCETQDEIDYYWGKLSAMPEAEQCGWLKDTYGFSWQISPIMMQKMFTEGDQEKIDRVTQVFLKMKKFDLAKLQTAYDGK